MTKLTSAPLPTPHEQILAITAGLWQRRALAVAAEAELADLLAAGPLHIDERTGTNSESLSAASCELEEVVPTAGPLSILVAKAKATV
jgi:hypothetical protein